MIADDRLCYKEDVKDICVSVTTTDTEYFMSFIEYETDDTLGIKYTLDDGTERFIALNKAYVISVGIVYQQDYDILLEQDTDDYYDTDIMYQ